MTASRESHGAFKKLNGPQKAAILLVAVGKNAASKIMKEMSASEIESVAREIAKIDCIPDDVAEQVLGELHEHALGRHRRAGGIDYARQLLIASIGPESGEEVLSRVRQALDSQSPSSLKQLDANQLLAFLQDEHPQTIALVLVHVSPHKAAVVLSGIPAPLRGDVARRMGRIGPTSLDAIQRIEEQLQRHGLAIQRSQRGGPQAVADVLHQVDRFSEEEILESIEDDDPELAREIRDLLFVFEDLGNRDDHVIQRLLKEVETRELALALKGASASTQAKIFENMPHRAKDVVLEEMSFMGATRRADIEGAQRTILLTLRQLEKEGTVGPADAGTVIASLDESER